MVETRKEGSALLSLENIHKSFGALDVLKGVSLKAHKGEVVCLIGSSGSGKSTLLRCANLLETPQQGEIRFLEQYIDFKGGGHHRVASDIKQLRLLRSKLSMVFQQFNLWSHMTILDNICEAPMSVLRVDRQAAEEKARYFLDKVGISEKADVYPAQLSGGQQQRVAIARALAMEPEAILFDEPTSALDPELEQEVIKVIRQLANDGRTMIIVTHDMNIVHSIADHVMFLHNGVTLEEGAPDKILSHPETERLQQFLRASD